MERNGSNLGNPLAPPSSVPSSGMHPDTLTEERVPVVVE